MPEAAAHVAHQLDRFRIVGVKTVFDRESVWLLRRALLAELPVEVRRRGSEVSGGNYLEVRCGSRAPADRHPCLHQSTERPHGGDTTGATAWAFDP